MFQLKIFNLILSTFLLACLSACTYLETQADKQAAIPAPSPIASSAETWPEISPYTGNTTVGILLEQINSPGWKTVWLRGHYQNQ